MRAGTTVKKVVLSGMLKKRKEKRKMEQECSYKESCRFYDNKRKKCIALKKLYCELEEKQCVFYKKKGSEVNDKNEN